MNIEIKPPKISTSFRAEKIYPALENLEVAPSIQEQTFKSSKYGFNNVKVNGIETEELTVTPSTEDQVIEGLFNKVTLAGDSDLIPENIKAGVEIFGVEGTAKTSSAKITSGSYLFYNGARTDCVNELLNLCENISSASNMFYGCSKLTELDLSNLDTSNCTTMSNMFQGCRSLTSLDLSNFDTTNVTNMSGMIQNCLNLTELDLSNFNTTNVTNMGSMFGGVRCTELDLSSFDMSNVNNIGYAFGNCDYLVNLKSFKNLGKGYTQKTANYSNYRLQLNFSNKLSHESLIDVITNGLYDLNLTYDVANGGTLYRQTLQLGSTNKAKLTAEEIAIATNKGWDVT